jgi:hypothetical protein
MFFVSERAQPYEPDGAAWLADTLATLIKRTPLAADTRVARIFRQSGTNGVLSEISRLESDHARRIYFQNLVEQAGPAGEALARALAQAGREIASSHELAELLISLADRALADASARAPYFTAAGSIESGHERRRVLAGATRGALDPDTLAAALTAAKTIESDHELAELLIGVGKSQALEGDARSVFFEAVASIDSDHECRRLLSAIIEANPSPELIAAVLRSAAGIDSSYELASLLVLAASTHSFQGSLRDQYIDAAQRISSSYERTRALAALSRRF